MRKAFLTIVFILVTVSISACGGGNDDGDAPGTDDGGDTGEPTLESNTPDVDQPMPPENDGNLPEGEELPSIPVNELNSPIANMSGAMVQLDDDTQIYVLTSIEQSDSSKIISYAETNDQLKNELLGGAFFRFVSDTSDYSKVSVMTAQNLNRVSACVIEEGRCFGVSIGGSKDEGYTFDASNDGYYMIMVE